MNREESYRQNHPEISGDDIFSSLGECAPNIICTLDRTGCFTYVNPAWEKILGHKPQEVMGRNFVDFVRPGDRPRFTSLYNRIREEKKTLIDIEGIFTAKNGEEYHFAVSGAPRFDTDGRLADMVTPLHDITGRIRSEVEETGLEPRFLKLEITETSVMVDPDECIRKISKLKELGIDFSIDDFGTGYSSLSYLKRFPITTLKIDRSFIVDSMNSRDDREIIRSIVKMAKNLGIETVAEGIETVEQQSLLTQLGCKSMQGFYFGRPVPDDEFEQTFFPDKRPA